MDGSIWRVERLTPDGNPVGIYLDRNGMWCETFGPAAEFNTEDEAIAAVRPDDALWRVNVHYYHPRS